MKMLNLHPMRSIVVREPGGPDVLELGEAPTPRPGLGELLVRVEAAGVNRPDLLQRRGLYPPPAGVTETLGLEIAGTVVSVGPETPRWREGDRVCALVAGGGYAEYCVAPVEQCLPIPTGWSMVEAASLPETFFTVWSNVFGRGRLAPGEVLLVHGGSSGIGVAAIQMAHARGNPVFATVGSADKREACERLGATRAINRYTEDFVQVVRDLTRGHGADVILDMVAGSYVPRDLDLLAPDGRLVFIATLGGASTELDVRMVMTKRLTVTGSTLRGRTPGFKGAIARDLEQEIWPLLERRAIVPVIHAVFPLARAADAHAELERGKNIGKIVLTVGPVDATSPAV